MQIIDSYRDAYSVDFNVLNEGRFQVDSSLTKTKEGKQVEVERKSIEKEAEWLERKAYNKLIREDRKRSVENLKNKNKRLREERKNALKGQKAKERDERKALRSYKKFGDSTIRSLYTYPPKFTVKWEAVDELNEDLFLDVKYGSIQHSLPFVDFLEDFLFVGNQQNVEPSTGNVKDYIEGFLNKMGTSSFYAFKTNPINTALETVPVYTLVNSYNEIITATTVASRDGIAKNTRDFFNEKVYDTCGAFDSDVERVNQLGFFFLNVADAEKCLRELAGSDAYGLDAAGAAINCIGLDCAYKITREHHPGVDFRFVPNYNEVKNLLSHHMGESDLIVEDEQQQLRFRRRAVPIFNRLGKYGEWLTPWNSFLQKDEYFKGVPIYIVQASNTPRNVISETYFKTAGQIDGLYGRLIQWVDARLGFGENWIMQGSLLNTEQAENSKTYVFFEKEQATKFIKLLGRKAVRFAGGRSDYLAKAIQKPRIFVYNLEDFVERWEDALVSNSDVKSKEFLYSIYNTQQLMFVPPETGSQEFTTPRKNKPFEKPRQILDARLRNMGKMFEALFDVPVDG